MTFTEVEPNEDDFDFKKFQSLPTGRWQVGINRMLFGKYRVEISLKGAGVYTVNYWGGEQELALLICGFILGICFWLPEGISGPELSVIFPQQNDKDLSADFFNQLFKVSERFSAHERKHW